VSDARRPAGAGGWMAALGPTASPLPAPHLQHPPEENGLPNTNRTAVAYWRVNPPFNNLAF